MEDYKNSLIDEIKEKKRIYLNDLEQKEQARLYDLQLMDQNFNKEVQREIDYKNKFKVFSDQM
jgi:DNA-binding protein Fis